jgi:hypothetical protein
MTCDLTDASAQRGLHDAHNKTNPESQIPNSLELGVGTSPHVCGGEPKDPRLRGLKSTNTC